MSVVTLDEAKKHLRVQGSDEDSLISLYCEAATERIVNFINQPIPGSNDSPVEAAPSSIRAAALLIVGDLYENRQENLVLPSGQLITNPSVMSLLYPYRVNIGI